MKPSVNSEFERLQRMIDQRNIRTEGKFGSHPYIRPKNASTIIVLDGKRGRERVLMGKRNAALKFMPGALVFPGGRVDRADHFISPATHMDKTTHAKIDAHTTTKSPASAKALGVAAIRELCEETGLIIGKPVNSPPKHPDWRDFAGIGMAPALSSLRLLGRAITPPGNVRRFDTWFFISRREEISHVPEEGFLPSGELEALEWLTLEEAISANSREITKVLLLELQNRLSDDPGLSPDTPVPSYRYVGKKFVRQLI